MGLFLNGSPSVKAFSGCREPRRMLTLVTEHNARLCTDDKSSFAKGVFSAN